MTRKEQNDEYFMRLALQEAEAAFQEGEIPIGAVLVYEQKIIARAYNQVQRLSDPTAHAELLCLSAASSHLRSKYLAQCRLYVTIEPCVMCAGAIRWAQISQLIYGANEEKCGYHLYNESIIPDKCLIKGGVLASEAKALMQDFFKYKR